MQFSVTEQHICIVTCGRRVLASDSNDLTRMDAFTARRCYRLPVHVSDSNQPDPGLHNQDVKLILIC